MKKNEDRIWDVLLEDAMRDMPAPEPAPPYEPGDYTRRLLTPIGPPGVDRGRSMRRTRSRRWASVAATLVAFLFVAGLFYAAVSWLPKLTEDNHADQPQTAGDNNPAPIRDDGGHDTPNKPVPSPNAAPENAPKDNTQPKTNSEPKPEANDQPDPEPNEQPEPQPEPKPEDQVEQPKPEPETQPEPEPKKPADTVEQPKQPDDTVEQPKPDETEPKQPEETTPEPDTKLHINLLTLVEWETPNDNELQYSPDGEIWKPALKLTKFAGNVWLRSHAATDFEAGGVLLRLLGTMRVSMTEAELEVELADDELYVDSRGARKDLLFSDGRQSATLTCCSVYFSRSASRTQVSLYEGDLAIGEDLVSGPKEGVLSKRGNKDFRALRRTKEENGYLTDLKPRVVYHEGFDSSEPKGRLREGEIQDGVLTGATVFWGYPEDIRHQDGLVVRLRVRFTNVVNATLTQFATPREDNFSYEINEEYGLKNGDWYTLEVPLSEFRERTNHQDPPNEDDWFQNVSLTPSGENAQVEIDWVELIRAVK